MTYAIESMCVCPFFFVAEDKGAVTWYPDLYSEA